MKIKILNWIYLLSFILFLSDLLTNFDIKNQFIKSFVYLFSTFGSILILGINLKFKKSKFFLTLSIIGILLIFIIGPIKILILKSAWKTQTTLYENEHFNFKKVEFQMQDIGARGYNKRNVEVIYLTKLFMLTYKVPNDIKKHVEWIKVNK